MRPEEIAVTVLRRWWIVAIAALVAGLVGFLGTSSQETTYTSSARIMAIAEPPDYWLDLYAKNRLASYKDLIANWTFVSEALAERGLQHRPESCPKHVEPGSQPRREYRAGYLY